MQLHTVVSICHQAVGDFKTFEKRRKCNAFYCYITYLEYLALEGKIDSCRCIEIAELILLISTPVKSNRRIASKASNCFEDDKQIHLLLVNSGG